MANDSGWVDDVRRWVASSRSAAPVAVSVPSTADADLGYEAAHPALMAQQWPETLSELPTERS